MDAMSPNDPAAFVAAALASKPDLIVHEADRPETVRAALKVLVQGSLIPSFSLRHERIGGP